MALRVLHIGKFFPPYHGGMEVFLADLIEAQRQQGLDAHALVHGDPLPEDPHWLTRVPVQVSLVYAPIALGFRKALKDAIARVQPDVLHLHMPNNSALWALTLGEARAIPWVVHWHSDVVASRIRPVVAVAYRLYRPFEQAMLAGAARVIATSPSYLAASEPLSRWQEKCAVVPLGLNTSKPPGSDSTGLTKPAWQPGHLRLLSVGRLTYYKGFETLIRAVAPLADAELLIVGDGELRASLEALIQELTPAGAPPSMRLLGNIDDGQKHALLAQCDVFCLASRERTEAFGMVLLEAMQHARPCIVSALPGSGMPWVVAHAGAGLQVPPDDLEGWRAAIRQLGDDPALRARYGAAGQRALHSVFSITTCERSVFQQYELAMPEAWSGKPRDGVLIVIPARNEATTIGALLERLHTQGWRDVLVIDDQSTDGTGAIARAAGARVLNPVLPMGAWGGMQAGICYALAQGYQAVITMDADGQHEVEEIPALLAAQSESDLVIGAFPERASRLRHLAWQWFRRIAGFDLRDLTSGFRLYNLSAMRVLASREATLLDYQDLGALLLVRRAGLTISEVPVSMNMRVAGTSRIFNSWLSVGKYMIATTLLCLARWDVRQRKAP
ncbi:MAG: glycosyltransferase [Acidovorax sp.]|uniref:glycosyltransferase n=1 Tax=Acidovorax sp. TaxID=1872122 RepID=UPI0025BCB9E6|nr:glycosyltransferase [Acidovorax sp.]MCE1191505.1 glycosyltransferase [Acidovorax sp.]